MTNLFKLALPLVAILAFHSVAQAAGNEKSGMLVKGSKSYQSRIVPGKTDKTIAASPTSVEQVEPAAGIETVEEKNSKKNTTMKLQEQIKLPRKN